MKSEEPVEITETAKYQDNRYYGKELAADAIDPFPSISREVEVTTPDDNDDELTHHSIKIPFSQEPMESTYGDYTDNRPIKNNSVKVLNLNESKSHSSYLAQNGSRMNNSGLGSMDLYPIQEEDPRELVGSSYQFKSKDHIKNAANEDERTPSGSAEVSDYTMVKRTRNEHAAVTDSSDAVMLTNESVQKGANTGLKDFTPASELNLSAYEGQQDNLVRKYLHADLLDKDNADSKAARHALGIGMPEVRAIHKRMKLSRPQGGSTLIKSFYEYIQWYRLACKISG